MATQGLLRENWAPTISQLEMPRRRSERWLTPAEHVKSLHQASSDRFYADSGSPYPCSQSELDFHHQGRFLRENRGPFVSLSRATEEVMVQNDERRRPSFDERRAILNLEYAIHDHNFVYHPDIIVKVFNDLDTLFFGGRLSGNVLVSWPNSTQCAELETTEPRLLRWTDGFTPGEQGQARIYLNPNTIFLGKPANEDPLRKMFSTLIHEMVHAYEFVRCTVDWKGRDCHDEYFSTKLDVIHQRALRTLGINVIKEYQTYRQSLWFKDFVDEAYINRSPGTYDSNKHDDDSPSDVIGRRDELWFRNMMF